MKRLVCMMIAALFVAGGFAGCGDDGGGDTTGGPATSGAGAGGSETTAPSGGTAAGTNGANAEMCTIVQDVNGPDYVEAIARAREVDPPSELADMWDQWLDDTLAISEGDPDNEMDAESMDRWATEASRITVWLIENCDVTG